MVDMFTSGLRIYRPSQLIISIRKSDDILKGVLITEEGL